MEVGFSFPFSANRVSKPTKSLQIIKQQAILNLQVLNFRIVFYPVGALLGVN